MENQIINGDCFEVLKDFPDNYFDAVITDPPYMTTDLTFDKIGFNVQLWLSECLRILKNDGYLISFGSIKLLGEISNVFFVRWSGFWLKPSGVMRTHSAKKPMSQSEPYCVFAHPNHKISNLIFNKLKNEGKPYIKKQNNTGYKREGKDSLSRVNTSAWTRQDYVCSNDGFRWQTDVITAPSKQYMKHKERTEHPTQKPVKLIKTLVEMLTHENGIVLDPFAGSFTTAIACLETGRRYVCIEKEKDYFEIGKQRITQWHNEQLDKTGTHDLPDDILRIKDDPTGQMNLF